MDGVLASPHGLLVDTRLMTAMGELPVERRDEGWVLAGPDSGDVRLVNDYLGYLGDRHYAPGTRRGYAFDLLALLRWLAGQDRRLDQVDTDVLPAVRVGGQVARQRVRGVGDVPGEDQRSPRRAP
jgi:hypothetical protein